MNFNPHGYPLVMRRFAIGVNTFTNVTSTPRPADPPFIVEENVTVATAGDTPVIPPTPPLAGQVACSAQ